MSILHKRPWLRWVVPAGVAAVVLAAGLGIGSVTASATPSLPPRSAAQLLVDLQTSSTRALSGTVVVRADLGLPAALLATGDPEGSEGAGGTGLTSVVNGSHTLRVWYSNPDQARIALLDTLGETDIIASGTDRWIWSSRQNTATHRTLPAHRAATPTPSPLTTLSPTDLATLVLSRVDESTAVTTAGPVRVAERDAYELVARPRDDASLIGTVRVAIDAKEHVPLRLQVFPRAGGAAAIDAAFTQISFARPDPQHFTFNPPPGAKIIEDEAPNHTGPLAALTANDRTTTVVGTGWTAVLVAALPETDQYDTGPTAMAQVLPAVTGTWGSGHLVTGPLANILITDDGRVLAGAVTPERLYQAAADPHAKVGS